MGMVGADQALNGIPNIAEGRQESPGSQTSGVLACGPGPLCEELRQVLATTKSARSPSGPRGLFLGLAGPSAQVRHLRGCPPHCKGQTALSFRDVG